MKVSVTNSNFHALLWANRGEKPGLPVAVIRNHRGFIMVESSVGKGSLFSVFLPAVKNYAAKAEES